MTSKTLALVLVLTPVWSPSTASAQAERVSLSLDDVAALVAASDLPYEVKRNAIWDECRNFAMTDSAVAQLRNAGASETLINDIRSACFFHVDQNGVTYRPSGLELLAFAAEATGLYTVLPTINSRHTVMNSVLPTGQTIRIEEWLRRPNLYIRHETGRWSGAYRGRMWFVDVGMSGSADYSAEWSPAMLAGAEFEAAFDPALRKVEYALTLKDTAVVVNGNAVQCWLVLVKRSIPGMPLTRECYDKERGFMSWQWGSYAGLPNSGFVTVVEAYAKNNNDLLLPARVRSSGSQGSSLTTLTALDYELIPDSIFRRRESYNFPPSTRQRVAGIGTISGNLTSVADVLFTEYTNDEIVFEHFANAEVEVEVKSDAFSPVVRLHHYHNGAYITNAESSDPNAKKKSIKVRGTAGNDGLVVVRVLANGRVGGAYTVTVKKK